LEAHGLATILVTNMPYWAEKIGAPRTLAVEFPFGHMLGQPGDAVMQRRVIEQALEVLRTVETPGAIVHSEEVWPVPALEAMKTWQPTEPSPVIAVLGPQLREMLRGRRS
jgi:D-proline reductase (dithiol) PrdB